MKTYIAIVDPIVSPLFLTQECHKHGIGIVGIFSLRNLSDEQRRSRFHPELFDITLFPAHHSLDEVASILTRLSVQHVFYGYEGSVEWADQLAHAMGLSAANDPATSAARYDKYAMQEALAAAGLPTVKQCKLHKGFLQNAASELTTFTYPLIVKPLGGAGSIGVKECTNLLELTEHIDHSSNMLVHAGEAQAYLVQEKLLGTEYLVDTVSLKGQHQVVSVFKYVKMNDRGYPIYRSIDSVDPKSTEWQHCSQFAKAVLNAVGLNNGFAHTELFLTPQGPRLVEVNARISGASGSANQLAQILYGNNQVLALLNCIKTETYKPLPVHAKGVGRVALIQNWQENRIIGSLNMSLLTTLASYQDAITLKAPGSQVGLPKTLLDTLCLVILAHKDKAQLEADYAKLTLFEQSGELL